MLICPICRNQNLDTAKFCGNCGNSFTRSSTSTSSLINCAQGHVYSAVYEHCPYCPQSQFDSRDSDFATRVETPITAIDPSRATGPTTYATLQSPNDFVTRVDNRETVFETSESPTLPPPAPRDGETGPDDLTRLAESAGRRGEAWDPASPPPIFPTFRSYALR